MIFVWVSLICLYIIGFYSLFMLLFDFFCFFGVKKKALIKDFRLVEKNLGGDDIWYDIEITYEFNSDDINYISSRKNGFNNFLTKDRRAIEGMVKGKDIYIYYISGFPNLSICFPFKFNLIVFFTFIFVGLLIPTVTLFFML